MTFISYEKLVENDGYEDFPMLNSGKEKIVKR